MMKPIFQPNFPRLLVNQTFDDDFIRPPNHIPPPRLLSPNKMFEDCQLVFYSIGLNTQLATCDRAPPFPLTYGINSLAKMVITSNCFNKLSFTHYKLLVHKCILHSTWAKCMYVKGGIVKMILCQGGFFLGLEGNYKIILYIKATVVVYVCLCGQCLEDSSSHCPFPVEFPQM
jgi:hypothetical protein